MEFEYVGDENFQSILRRDYLELKKCQESKSSKSILVLSGSILEAILADYLCENLPTGQSKNSILQTPLATLLDYAEAQGVINKSDKNLASVIKDYRNLIHPGREVRKKEVYDYSNAEIAISVLEMLIRKIENKYKEKFDLSVNDILFNLDEDINYKSIFPLIITKLNPLNKMKLFDELLDIEMVNNSDFHHFASEKEEKIYPNIDPVKDHVIPLKPLLGKEGLLKVLNDLKKYVKDGLSLEALSAYNLLHEDLILLDKEDQELIAIYMLSLYSEIFENSRDLYYQMTYSTIGNYIYSDPGKAALKRLVEFSAVHFTQNTIYYEMETLEQILNSLNSSDRKEVLDHLQNYVQLSLDFLTDFGIEASKRGLILFP